MDINPENQIHSFFSQLLPLLLSFCDDALILGLSQIGLKIDWLQWISQVVLSCTIVYWAVKGWQNRHYARKFIEAWQPIARKS